MPDAELGNTVETLVHSKYGNAGQRCLAIQNIVVVGDDNYYNKFKNSFVERTKALKVGYGLNEGGVEMGGPMTTDQYRRNVMKKIDDALNEGAKLVLDGRNFTVNGYPSGFYLGPTILEDVSPTMATAREEIFGPVVNLMRAKELDEAVSWINAGGKYHHSAVIFTQNGKWARTFSNEVRVGGNVGVNIGVAAPVGWFPLWR